MVLQNLPLYNQLIWEYPERGDYAIGYKENDVGQGSATNFSWVSITYIKDNNPKNILRLVNGVYTKNKI